MELSNLARSWRAFAVAALVAGGALVAPASSTPRAHAGNPVPAPVMTGYVPLDADATQATMENANAAADTTLDFTVGITNAGAGAVMTYDHWEDGFEADLTNPVQTTTQVWGDSDPANGNAQTWCGVNCTGDVLPAGAVFVLRNNIPTPRNAAAVLWDGRDRVASTRGFTITAGGFSTPLGSVLSASASAYDTSKWGVDYWIPVGENVGNPSGTSPAFSTSSLQIMASQPNTVVRVDTDGDGDDDVVDTIGQGEVTFVDGGVNRGAHVRSSKPVQVHEGAGDAGAAYELRWFTLFPTNLLSADYLNPVGSFVDNQRTITFLFNPGSSAVTVTPTCTGCSGTINLPAGGGASLASPVGRAVRFQGTAPFVAVGASGAQSGAAPGSSGDGSATFDWGFGLVPAGLLTTKASLGWAPGNSNNPPASPSGNRDDDPVWISTLADTTLFVDFDGNPATGASSGSCDGSYDTSIAVLALTSTRIFDATDGDMTGARIYTCDGVKLAGAWGEDAATAPTGAPGFDAGYALVPSTSMVVDKSAGVATDVNGDGRIGPGDEVLFDISIADAGALAFTNVVVNDAMPSGATYIAGSTQLNDGTTTIPFADDAVPPAATPYPFDEGGAAVPNINAGTTMHLTYRLRINDPFPAGTTVTNSVSVGADETDSGDTIIIDLVAADLSLAKTVTVAPSFQGDQATFRITVTNDGPDQAGGVVVADLLPTGLGFVSSSPSQGTYDAGTGLWSVGTIANGGSATLDIVATVTALSATNSAEIVDTDAADPDSTPGNGPNGEDDEDSVTVTVSPSADLSLTKTRDAGPAANGDTSFTLTVTNSGAATATGVTVLDQPPAGATFVSASANTSAGVDGTFAGGTNTWTVPSLPTGAIAVMHVVYRTNGAPGFNAAQVSAMNEHDVDSTPGTAPLDNANPPDEDDEARVTIPGLADLSVTNVVTTPPSHVGDLVTFTVTVRNDGPTDATGVVVRDLLPAGLVFVSSSPSLGAYDAGVGLWTVGGLPNGATQTLTITARVMSDAPISTTAEVSAANVSDVDSTPSNGIAAEDDQQSASLAVSGGSIGDRVWSDLDADGVQDAGEPGIAGLPVTVVWAGPNNLLGDGDDVTSSTTTDSGGVWSVIGLPAGTFRVSVDTSAFPSGTATPTFDLDGTATAGRADINLVAGQARVDVDFGFNLLASAAPTTTTTTLLTGALPTTGGDVGPAVLLAAILAVGGAILLVVTRRRRAAV